MWGMTVRFLFYLDNNASEDPMKQFLQERCIFSAPAHCCTHIRTFDQNAIQLKAGIFACI